jgi:hypothetical protein
MSTMTTTGYAPRGLEVAGRRLWKKITDEFELGEHEKALLLETARTLDQCNRLADATDGAAGASPALTELRQQRLVLAKLVAALKLPGGLDPAPTPFHKRSTSMRKLSS